MAISLVLSALGGVLVSFPPVLFYFETGSQCAAPAVLESKEICLRLPP